MTLPYENAKSGDQAFADIQKILNRFNCDSFGIMQKRAEQITLIQFEWRGRRVELRGAWGGYAALWLKENPWSSRRRCTDAQHREKAMEIAQLAVCSMLRDWVKAQVTAVESGLMSFEEVFMPHMLLPSGQRMVEAAQKLLGQTQ